MISLSRAGYSLVLRQLEEAIILGVKIHLVDFGPIVSVNDTIGRWPHLAAFWLGTHHNPQQVLPSLAE